MVVKDPETPLPLHLVVDEVRDMEAHSMGPTEAALLSLVSGICILAFSRSMALGRGRPLPCTVRSIRSES